MLAIIRFGYLLEFLDLPPLGHLKITSYSPALQEEVSVFLQKHTIQCITSQEALGGFYSRYFMVPKKDGSLRSQVSQHLRTFITNGSVWSP